ncbi:unnamed protein product [Schistosoma spindalis]|nr:unnamed protein product [Schistosoma spindale]
MPILSKKSSDNCWHNKIQFYEIKSDNFHENERNCILDRLVEFSNLSVTVVVYSYCQTLDYVVMVYFLTSSFSKVEMCHRVQSQIYF